MKIAVSIIILVAMLASMAVQYNDPDPILWSIIYGYAAVMAANAIRNRYNAVMLFIGALGYVIGGIALLPEELEGWITNELARESGGLFVSAACMIVLIGQMFIAKSMPDAAENAGDSSE